MRVRELDWRISCHDRVHWHSGYFCAASISEPSKSDGRQGNAWNNLGNALSKSGDATGAARALVRGLVVKQRVEQDVGVHDDRRVSMFEEQQKTYRRLQDVLLGQAGQEGWALGVASQAQVALRNFCKLLVAIQRNSWACVVHS